MAAAGWMITVTQMHNLTDMAMGPLFPFLAVWIAMMVAMMFPSVAPIMTLFSTVSRNHRAAGERTAPTWVFLIGYLTIWSLFGVGAYLLSVVMPAVGMSGPELRTYSPIAGGLVLIVAGVYEWSLLKRVLLEHCRSPLGFLMHGWRDGYVGAFRLGAIHGAYCVGCCLGLMAVLFTVGLMNLGWMVLLAAIIFVEKVVPWGQVAGKFVGAILAWYGITVVFIGLSGSLS
jgi:predicted metal-binding membrane protein